MNVSISKQNLARIRRKVESELEDMRESVRRGTVQADSGRVVPADEVFGELRERNAGAILA